MAAEEKKKEELAGEVTHYYSKLKVGIIKLKKPLKLGEKIKIKGHTTDIEQTIQSLQYQHQDIKEGKKGQEVGTKVKGKVREGDQVYKV